MGGWEQGGREGAGVIAHDAAASASAPAAAAVAVDCGSCSNSPARRAVPSVEVYGYVLALSSAAVYGLCQLCMHGLRGTSTLVWACMLAH